MLSARNTASSAVAATRFKLTSIFKELTCVNHKSPSMNELPEKYIFPIQQGITIASPERKINSLIDCVAELQEAHRDLSTHSEYSRSVRGEDEWYSLDDLLVKHGAWRKNSDDKSWDFLQYLAGLEGRDLTKE